MNCRLILFCAVIPIALPTEIMAMPTGGNGKDRKPSVRQTASERFKGFPGRGQRLKREYFKIAGKDGKNSMVVVRLPGVYPAYRFRIYPGRSVLGVKLKSLVDFHKGRHSFFAPKGDARHDGTLTVKVEETQNGTSEVVYAWRGENAYCANKTDGPLYLQNGRIGRRDVPALLDALEKRMKNGKPDTTADTLRDVLTGQQ